MNNLCMIPHQQTLAFPVSYNHTSPVEILRKKLLTVRFLKDLKVWLFRRGHNKTTVLGRPVSSTVIQSLHCFNMSSLEN